MQLPEHQRLGNQRIERGSTTFIGKGQLVKELPVVDIKYRELSWIQFQMAQFISLVRHWKLVHSSLGDLLIFSTRLEILAIPSTDHRGSRASLSFVNGGVNLNAESVSLIVNRCIASNNCSTL
jgi:hypothetical protein